MLGTPKTKAFETRVKTLVRTAWKAEGPTTKSWRNLEKTIRDPAAPGRSLNQRPWAGCGSDRRIICLLQQLQQVESYPMQVSVLPRKPETPAERNVRIVSEQGVPQRSGRRRNSEAV